MNQNVKSALIIGGIVVAVLVVLPLVFGLVSGSQYGGWGMMGGFGMGFGAIFMVLFWGLIIWGIVALARGAAWSGGSDSGAYRMDSPLEVLKKRYARGEISKEEYEEKKRDLA